MLLPTARTVAQSASARRLQQLIEERTANDADRSAIDRRIWSLFGERWAVMFTDLSGFSRGVEQFGIIHFLQVIHESLLLFIPEIDRHDGILLKVEADSLMVIFRQPASALACAHAMQAACHDHNLGRSPEDHVLLCVGLGYGDMLRLGDADVFGAEVNAASKLGEDIANSGEILVTESVRNALPEAETATWTRLSEAPSGAVAAWKVN
jgi:class 3 adenylate cyclase